MRFWVVARMGEAGEDFGPLHRTRMEAMAEFRALGTLGRDSGLSFRSLRLVELIDVQELSDTMPNLRPGASVWRLRQHLEDDEVKP